MSNINLNYIGNIIQAVVSNPNFFDPKDNEQTKIQQVVDLIKQVDEVSKQNRFPYPLHNYHH